MSSFIPATKSPFLSFDKSTDQCTVSVSGSMYVHVSVGKQLLTSRNCTKLVDTFSLDSGYCVVSTEREQWFNAVRRVSALEN